MENLQGKIENILEHYTGRFGIVVHDLNSGMRWERCPDMVFPAASMIKVPIMYEVMRQVANGRLSLEQSMTVSQAYRVDGAGILKELRPDIAMTVRELVTLMIVLSDNTATNMLIELGGMDEINAAMHDLGLTSTVLRRKMMDFGAAKVGRENFTSAADMALLFEILYTGKGVPRGYGELMLDILKRQQIRDKLPFYLPEETVIANKTGTLTGVEHDGGILYLPGGPCIVCALTGDLPANYQGIELVAKLGKAVYDQFRQDK